VGGEAGRQRQRHREGDRYRTAAQRRAQTPVVQRHLHPDGKHQRGETELVEQREVAFSGVNDPQCCLAEDHTGEQLADDRRDRAVR